MSTFKNPQIQKEWIKLDNRFKIVRLFSKDTEVDEEIEAMLTQFLCVRVSSFIQISVRKILLGYAQKHSNGNITRFIEINLDRSRNPSQSEIADLLKKFNNQWFEDFKNYLGNNSDLGVLDSINNNRNAIAHKADPSHLDLSKLETFYQGAVTIVEKLEEFIDTK